MEKNSNENCLNNTTYTKPVRFITKIENVPQLSEAEKNELAPVTQQYSFRANNYYLSLIDWSDPNDPIRQLIIPQAHELEQWGQLDPSGEHNYTILPGLEHKYKSTVLFLVSNVCGGICRYCFRKRVFIHRQKEILTDLPAAAEYIKNHREITNILLTGGDPLALVTAKLEKYFDTILPIDHVKIIRIGSKMPAFNPYRILDDSVLLDLIQKCYRADKQLYFIVHFNHAKELTDLARQGLKALQRAGAIVANQTPIIRGINDNVDALAELFEQLSCLGVPPYYVFQCRPASGNKSYAVPIETAYEIFAQAKARVSGLAKRARYVMSHRTGKIEILGLTENHIFFKYHRAALDQDSEKFMVCRRNPNAYWFDDYDEPVESQSLNVYQDTFNP